ncbi:MAG: hypothetical protein ACJAVI_001910 [Candidatus Azotimanducaceae bacterium]|jgi:uncharacterized protein (DUF58 family)
MSSRLFSRTFAKWLDKRMPPANAVTLNQGNVFILPTREGVYFTFLIVFMVLAGINYQNSLVFGLAFLLFSMLMVSILHTYRNLSGITLQSAGSKPAFAGDDVEFDVNLTRAGVRTYEALQLGWQKNEVTEADLLEEEQCLVNLFLPTKQRGVLDPGRLLIQTRYPVGLFRAWSWVDLDMTVLVYPRPVVAGPIPGALSSSGEGDALQRDGVDDFYGFRDYQSGDSLRHVAWKNYARSDDLLLKEFAAHVDRRIWIDWEYLAGDEVEVRLSKLCYWVVQLAATQDEYGLRLPGTEVAPGRGLAHRNELLHQLATFGQDAIRRPERKK